MADDLFFSTIPELNTMLTSKKISAVELTKEFGARLETLGPKYNALALALTKDALKRAKEVDGDMKRERLRGPLQGIPYGAKDLLSYAKFPTTWGAKPYAAQTFDYTATAITRLEKTGSAANWQAGDGGIGGWRRVQAARRLDVRAGQKSMGRDAMVRRVFQRFGKRGGGGSGSVRNRL